MRTLACTLLVLALSACSSESPETVFRRQLDATTRPLKERLAGKRCELHRDGTGLFHARGADELMVYACLGYLHGRHRGFQADYLRRTAQGRIAELLGVSSYRTDFFFRMLGLADHAAKLTATLPERDRSLLDAYTEGMNSGLAAALGAGQYEFEKLGYVPEPWRPADTGAVLLLESFNETQSALWLKLKESARRERLGEQAPELFRREGLPWDVAILKDEASSPKASSQSATPGKPPERGSAFPVKTPPVEKEGTGSNSWVVAPRKSATGKAWLANDPHLELVHPPFWFWAHLEGGDIDAVGVSVPGAPFMPSGFNRFAAWGITDSYLDAGDVVSVPEVSLADLPTERPVIRVKLGFLTIPVPFKSFRRTAEGWPVLPTEGPPGRALVLRWTGLLLRGSDVAGIDRILRARSVRDLDRAFSELRLPSWNFVFADIHGAIGFRAEGAVLKQSAPAPFGVRALEASALALGPESLLTPDEMPHAVDPPQGWIATANNRQWPAGSRFDGGRSHPHGLRAFRIEELLTARPRHDGESMRAIQCDVQAVDARFLVPRLLKFVDRPGSGLDKRQSVVTALEELRRWDFEMRGDCRACSLYQRWIDRIEADMALDIGAIFRAVEQPERFGPGIVAALEGALKDLRADVGAPIRGWAEVQQAHFPHLTKSRTFATSQWLSAPGNPYSVNPAKSTWEGDHYELKHGTSGRLIVELTTPPRATFSLAGTAEDGAEKRLTDDAGPWVRWRDCKSPAVEFPLEWAKVKREEITL